MWRGFWRTRRERDLDEEIAEHLRLAVRDRIEQGQTREGAEAGARREFGNVGLVKDVTREMWGVSSFGREAKWAWRNLKARRMRSVLTVGLLGLALGANTLVFLVADSLMFHRAPYREPDRLIEIQTPIGRGTAGSPFLRAPLLEEWRTHQDLFEGVHGHLPKTIFLTDANEAEIVSAADITPGLIELLGMSPGWGRTLTVSDARQGNPQVVLIAEALARKRFGDPVSALGRTLATPAEPLLVVGVMPNAFRFPGRRESGERWIPEARWHAASQESLQSLACGLASHSKSSSRNLADAVAVSPSGLAGRPPTAPSRRRCGCRRRQKSKDACWSSCWAPLSVCC
jgi:hypothetical protein